MLNVIVRALSMIILGVLLISEQEVLTLTIVQCFGVAVIVPGLFSLISLVKRWGEKDKVYFWLSVISASVCIILGCWLFFAPGSFIIEVVLLLGLLLIALGVYQFYMFWCASRYITISALLYLPPVLLIVAGIFIIITPAMSVSLVMLVVGISLIVAGIVELLRMKFNKDKIE